MDTTDTILTSGFRLGRLFRADWKLNFLFPAVALAAMWRMQDVWLGLLAVGVLLFSVVAHELAHLVTSRMLGGEMDEVELWPLGGLTHPFGRGYLSDHGKVLFAGPLTNLCIAISCITRLSSEQISNILTHCSITAAQSDSLLLTTIQLMFGINLMLFVVNLIPVVPFDAGVLLRTYLTDRFSDVESRDLMIRSGLVVGVFGLLCGFVFDQSALIAASAFLVILHTHENMKWLEMLTEVQESERLESQSTTADELTSEDLEGWSEFGPPLDELDVEPAVNATDVDEFPDEQLIDEILAKLHLSGRESLTAGEVDALQQVSNQLRQKRSF